MNEVEAAALSGRNLTLLYPEGCGPENWELNHPTGEMPDKWLYGLNYLAESVSLPIRTREVGRVGASGRLRALTGIGLDNQTTVCDLVATWDERMAVRSVAAGFVGGDTTLISGVIWENASRSPRSIARNSLTQRVLRRAEGLWFLSRGQEDLVLSRYGHLGTSLRFIRFGIDVDYFAYSLPPDRPRVLSLGTDQDRDWEALRQILVGLRRARPHVEVRVQGAPEGWSVEGVVSLPWMTHEELRREYHQSSIVLVPTRPNLHASGMTVACEAMSCGRPVIASSTPGMDDYVVDGITGRLCASGEVREALEAIIALLDDDGLRLRLGDAGAAHARRALTSRRMAHEIGELINHVSA